jgi:glycosyltransferase involved in cell wall biosynthesis
MKILFLVPYPPGEAPSQRFRFEQYLHLLEKQGHQIRTQSFLSAHDWRLFYAQGHVASKLWALLKGFVKRLFSVLGSQSYHFIFLHREAAPVGPPVFEWLIARVFQKKIIYDFDDAIWLTDKTAESKSEEWIRWRGKVAAICRWSYKISCGNEYLAGYARLFSPRVVVNPTTIDTEGLHHPDLYQRLPEGNKIVIGWTGSHSTLKYLHSIEAVLKQLLEEYENLSFLVIADQQPALSLPRMEFLHWKKETEAADLMKMDIGIMPLPDDPWTRGKCGFKVLQYMAMNLPCIASPVGVNTSIMEHGINGYLAATGEEWRMYLKKLIGDASLRQSLGQKGRKKVIEHYSVSSNLSNFLSLFE